jgi:hypothetical protein
MKLLIKIMLVTQIAFCLGMGSSPLTAAEPRSVAKPPSVAYRLKETKTIHFDDTRKAQLHLQTVRKLGCQAKMDDHGGHMDVSYRLTSWSALTLTTEQAAHQWEGWMKKSGFETLHAHGEDHDHVGHDQASHNHGAADESHAGHNHSLADGHFHGDGHDHGHESAEIVTYSLPNWTTAHTRDSRESDELTAVLKGLGCEVRTGRHDDHGDVVFRCSRPMHIEFPSHRAASGWEDWMKRTGFRTQHVH